MSHIVQSLGVHQNDPPPMCFDFWKTAQYVSYGPIFAPNGRKSIKIPVTVHKLQGTRHKVIKLMIKVCGTLLLDESFILTPSLCVKTVTSPVTNKIT